MGAANPPVDVFVRAADRLYAAAALINRAEQEIMTGLATLGPLETTEEPLAREILDALGGWTGTPAFSESLMVLADGIEEGAR